MRQLLLASLIGICGFVGSANEARACDPVCVYKKVVSYETTTEYVSVQVPYEMAVTKYDHCGRAYVSRVTCYRTVRVPVQKSVPVVKWVRVCH